MYSRYALAVQFCTPETGRIEHPAALQPRVYSRHSSGPLVLRVPRRASALPQRGKIAPWHGFPPSSRRRSASGRVKVVFDQCLLQCLGFFMTAVMQR